MYIDWRGIRDNLRTLFHRPTIGKTLTAIIIGGAWFIVRVANEIFQRLDLLLYKDLSEQKVERPIFMFANPRSGTTLLHRLMSMDEERFATIKLYQTILPNICSERFFEAVQGLYRSPLGWPARFVITAFNNQFKKRWKGIHAMDLFTPEEDEAVFVFFQKSLTMTLLLPHVDRLQDQIWLDRNDEETQDRCMRSYRGVLQRVMYINDDDKRFLNKNVFFSTRLKALHRHFPDATFVYLIRNPFESLPSFLNMFYQAWHVHSPKIAMNSPEMEELIQIAFDYYRYSLTCSRELPAENFITIRYEDLVADLKGTVTKLYADLGEEMSPEFQAKLEETCHAHREYESTHKYSLEQFGLSEERVYNELKDVFETYGYERPNESQPITGTAMSGPISCENAVT